jgi:hypothetical protein
LQYAITIPAVDLNGGITDQLLRVIMSDKRDYQPDGILDCTEMLYTHD